MRPSLAWLAPLAALLATGCSATTATTNLSSRPERSAVERPAASPRTSDPIGAVAGGYRGFDRNDYPGDDIMHQLMTDHAPFAFTGFWVTPPPGETTNNWAGKRDLLKRQGWGFLVLANGRFEKEILAAQKKGTAPDALGRADAAKAVASAKAEGFPARTILFLDQEEGGRLTVPQSAYLLAWTEAVAAAGFRAGIYASAQPVNDGPGVTITTVQDVRKQLQEKHLHTVEVFAYRDDCPPAPGCTLAAKPIQQAGEPDLTAWQYAQSPRRPEITRSCAATYAADGNCYAPNFPKLFLDMDLATSADPSQGR